MAESLEDIARKAYGGTLPARQKATVTLACGVKRCSRCRHWKRVAEFGASADRGDGLNNKCRDCSQQYLAEWHALPEHNGKGAEYTRRSRAENPERTARNRLAERCKAYGITPERYFELLSSQGGVCAICHTPPDRRMLAVDHDHACCPMPMRSCGRCVRGLLCSACNIAVGFYESPKWRTTVRAYLAGQNPG